MFGRVLVPLVWSLPARFLGREVNMCWQLLPGAVIGRQANEAVPMMAEDWRALKTQFDIKTGRTWPNLEEGIRPTRPRKCHTK